MNVVLIKNSKILLPEMVYVFYFDNFKEKSLSWKSKLKENKQKRKTKKK